MASVLVLTRSGELVQDLLSLTFLTAKSVLWGLQLHILVDGLVGAGAWRLFHWVGELLPIGEVRTILAHVCLGKLVGAWTWRRWHVLLLLWAFFCSNPVT